MGTTIVGARERQTNKEKGTEVESDQSHSRCTAVTQKICMEYIFDFNRENGLHTNKKHCYEKKPSKSAQAQQAKNEHIPIDIVRLENSKKKILEICTNTRQS